MVSDSEFQKYGMFRLIVIDPYTGGEEGLGVGRGLAHNNKEGRGALTRAHGGKTRPSQ